MFQFLFGLFDFWSDMPRSRRGWIGALAVAAAVVVASLVIDRIMARR